MDELNGTVRVGSQTEADAINVMEALATEDWVVEDDGRYRFPGWSGVLEVLRGDTVRCSRKVWESRRRVG